MKIVNIPQHGNQWHAWRSSVITATTASAIMESNPWCSPYQAWQRMLGLIPEQEETAAMRRGKELEEQARFSFMERYNMVMVPECVESDEFNFLGASLDGLSVDCKSILEIKCGKSSHELALEGVIPFYYQHQILHQLICTRAEKCFYYSFDGENGICIEVYPDPAFEAEYLPKARAFWDCIANMTPPSSWEFKQKSKDLIDTNKEKHL